MNVTVFISHLCHRFIPIAPEEIGFQVFYPFFAAHYLFTYKKIGIMEVILIHYREKTDIFP